MGARDRQGCGMFHAPCMRAGLPRVVYVLTWRRSVVMFSRSLLLLWTAQRYPHVHATHTHTVADMAADVHTHVRLCTLPVLCCVGCRCVHPHKPLLRCILLCACAGPEGPSVQAHHACRGGQALWARASERHHTSGHSGIGGRNSERPGAHPR